MQALMHHCLQRMAAGVHTRSYCYSRQGGKAARAATAKTAKWVEGWVVKLGLCPFAKKPMDTPEALRIAVTMASTEEELLAAADLEIAALLPGLSKCGDGGAGGGSSSAAPDAGGPETTLLVLANDAGYLADFETFHRMSWSVQERILEAGVVGELQLVLFHPRGVHNLYTSTPGDADAKSYAVRSPYPTFHFLREKDVVDAVTKHPSPETIPARNAAKLRKLGAEAARDQWIAATNARE